jgi:hypothetical protein
VKRTTLLDSMLPKGGITYRLLWASSLYITYFTTWWFVFVAHEMLPLVTQS